MCTWNQSKKAFSVFGSHFKRRRGFTMCAAGRYHGKPYSPLATKLAPSTSGMPRWPRFIMKHVLSGASMTGFQGAAAEGSRNCRIARDNFPITGETLPGRTDPQWPPRNRRRSLSGPILDMICQLGDFRAIWMPCQAPSLVHVGGPRFLGPSLGMRTKSSGWQPAGHHAGLTSRACPYTCRRAGPILHSRLLNMDIYHVHKL